MKQDFDDWELIIVAQGTDVNLLAAVQQAERRDPRIRSVHLDRLGLSLARNAAAEHARGQILAFTDDDCEPMPGWLSAIDRCFLQRPDVGIVAGDLVPSRASFGQFSTCPAIFTIEFVYVPAEWNYSAPPGAYWGGGNFAVRRRVFEEVGTFDPYLGPGTEFPSCEDVDFCLRAESANVSIWTTPKCVVQHTYGRRYGFRNVLDHHRGYALGSGALYGKLRLSNHRLVSVWGQPLPWTVRGRRLLKNPAREVREIYKLPFLKEGMELYLRKYELGSGGVSRLKASPT